MRFEQEGLWRSTRTFNDYPTRWRLEVPEAGLDLRGRPAFEDQEFITLISKPAFWEGRLEVEGTLAGRAVAGPGYAERSGFVTAHDLESFFGQVGREVRATVESIIPFDPSFEQARDLVASEARTHYMDGVDIDTLVDTMVRPVRAIVDRGGKSWRSYAALACCDVVGGDSREFVKWLAFPEFLHVGSLIVDDVQDGSAIRRGGPASHVLYGESIALNAGTACYFMGQQLLHSDRISSQDRLRLYDLYFEAMRAGHAGQALDLAGHDHVMAEIVRSGDSAALEAAVLATHRLKTAAPAGALARMGGIAGAGSEVQIEALGRFFESVGLAFQIIDDVLNLRGFEGDLKTRGEDIRQGKVTLPVAKAMGRLSEEQRRSLWDGVSARSEDEARLALVIETLEACGAVEACVEQAQDLVEAAWRRLDPVLEDSLPKLLLRAFGWYVLDRHY
jgi:geranylgeranyl pyrophosphate synthase